jgi:hypothetical protein
MVSTGARGYLACVYLLGRHREGSLLVAPPCMFDQSAMCHFTCLCLRLMLVALAKTERPVLPTGLRVLNVIVLALCLC